MKRVHVDISGAGPHTLITPTADERILINEAHITFAHASTEALRIWFWAGSALEAGPYYMTDGGELRYKNDDNARRYIGAPGAALVVTMDAGLKAAGTIDYELGST